MMIVIGDSRDPRDWPHYAQVIHRENQEILRLLRAQSRNQERIMAQNDEILTEVDDLQEAVAVINAGVTTLDGNLAAANSRLAELEAAGVAPATVEALRRAVDGAQSIADRFKAAVDPAQPTPTDPTPEPVEDVPTDTDAPAPEGSTPDAGVVEGEVVADPAADSSAGDTSTQ